MNAADVDEELARCRLSNVENGSQLGAQLSQDTHRVSRARRAIHAQGIAALHSLHLVSEREETDQLFATRLRQQDRLPPEAEGSRRG
jgi:hypothetical protein